MKRHRVVLILLFLLSQVGVSGCEKQKDSRLDEISKTITEMKKDVEFVRTQIESVRLEVTELRTKLDEQEIMIDEYKKASFDPAAAEGFSRLDTSVGSFAVSIQDVKPHADGVVVRLHVGNLTSARVNGGTFKVKWGPRRPPSGEKEWFKAFSDWKKNLKETEVKFTQELRPGTWNNVRLALPGIPPAKFGHLELTMKTDRISLIQP